MKTFLLVTLSLLFLTASSPQTQKAPPKPIPPAGVQARLISLVPADLSLVSVVSQPVSASDSQSLREVEDLAAARRATLAGPAGWLHIQTRSVQPHPDRLSPLAAGLDQFDQDQWLELDENGLVQLAVRKITGESGKTVQVSLLEGGIWNNLTLGAQSQAGAAAAFDPNYGFDALAAGLVRQGFALNKGILYKECWYQGEKYSISDGKLLHEAVFNTGFQTLRSIKTWQVTPAGDVSLVDSLEVLLEERAPQPPADVLALLQQALVLP
jgi:hypothetical protein